MSSTNPGAILPARERGAKSYLRFIVLCAARTGSYMLTSSLNSSPEIICFGEVFNALGKRVDYRVDGYDTYDPEAVALRERDLEKFINQRIFCEHPEAITTVGFKIHYNHFWGYVGLKEWITDQRQIRILHLRRRNLLRQLVSLRIADRTRVAVEYKPPPIARLFNGQNALKAMRRPWLAAAALRRAIRPRRPPGLAHKTAITLSVEECHAFFADQETVGAYYDELFQQHPMIHLTYEELVDHYDATLECVQTFLALDPRPLAPMTRKQNPEPLRELIANYDELYEAFRGTQEAAYFE